jgi:DNA-binding transcriptional ArsR family regulator
MKPKIYVIRERKQLAALVSAARQEIVDVLSQMGTVSVAELATALGRPADAIYYHVRVLKRAGLVRSAGNRGEGRRREELFRTVSPDLRLEYKRGDGGNGREISAIVSSMLRLGARDFRRAYQRGDAKVSGSGRELWALRTTGWLKAEEIASVNRGIHSLARTVSRPTGRGKLYGVTVLLTPLNHRARNKSAKTEVGKRGQK